MRWTASLFYSSRAHVTPSSARGFERMERPPPASRRLLYLQVAANTAGWFVVSIFMTLFNKWLFTSSGMHFPLLVTCVHTALKIPLAAAAMRVLGVPRLSVPRRMLWRYVVPTGAATSLDIGLSNASFMFISVTYYTIVKSSVPLWILLISLALGMQRPSVALGAVVVAIVAGITLASLGPEAAASAAPGAHDNATAIAGSSAVERLSRRLVQLHPIIAR